MMHTNILAPPENLKNIFNHMFLLPAQLGPLCQSGLWGGGGGEGGRKGGRGGGGGKSGRKVRSTRPDFPLSSSPPPFATLNNYNFYLYYAFFERFAA